MQIYAVYQKSEAQRFISHLDIQRTLQRAFRRAGVPLAYSAGFNPHPQLSFAAAAATGSVSECEWFEVKLSEPMEIADFVRRTNASLPEGLRILHAEEAPEKSPTLTAMIRSAEYEIFMDAGRPVTRAEAEAALAALLSGEILTEKKTKGGMRTVDIRPQIFRADVTEAEGQRIVLSVLGKLAADGGLRPDHLVAALRQRMGLEDPDVLVRRKAMYFDSEGSLPRLPA